MTAWILVALAIAAVLVALAAELLARHTTALTALATTAACTGAAFVCWHQTWGVAVLACAVGFLVGAGAETARERLPPYVTGTNDDESEP